MRESSVDQRFQLECARLGILEQRNNVGACMTEAGRMVRYGLMNESKKQNDEIKSSDRIAVTPILITPEWVGRTVGVYSAFETKHSDWYLTPGDTHAQAQAAYHRLVIHYGGFAGFVTNEADVRRIIGLER